MCVCNAVAWGGALKTTGALSLDGWWQNEEKKNLLAQRAPQAEVALKGVAGGRARGRGWDGTGLEVGGRQQTPGRLSSEQQQQGHIDPRCPAGENDRLGGAGLHGPIFPPTSTRCCPTPGSSAQPHMRRNRLVQSGTAAQALTKAPACLLLTRVFPSPPPVCFFRHADGIFNKAYRKVLGQLSARKYLHSLMAKRVG